MNPLTTLITSLQHELGLGNGTTPPESVLSVQSLQEIIMESAITKFIATEDTDTSRSFVEWVEAHEHDGNLLTEVFEKFPTLLTAVHTEMVEAIDSAKKVMAV